MNKVLQQLMKLLRSQKEFWAPPPGHMAAEHARDIARMSTKDRILWQQAGSGKGKYNRILGAGVLRKGKAKRLKTKGPSRQERREEEIMRIVEEMFGGNP